MKRNRVLVERYSDALERMEKDLDSLDSQVTKLTSGDLRIAKKRDGKIKFNPQRDAKSLEVYGGKDGKHGSDDIAVDSADEDEKFKRKLFKKCFDRKNIALGRMTRTVEKLVMKKENYVRDLEKLLLRAQLDRPQMLNEKFYCIWRDAPAVDTALEKEERMRSTARLLGKSLDTKASTRRSAASNNLNQ